MSLDQDLTEYRLRAAATAPETTVVGAWTFDGGGGLCTDEGWVSVDLTAQTGVYFHVDDFDGLGGGDFGRLNPLEGSQSMWCGARLDPNNSVLCGYATLPGYGDLWDQTFGTVNCVSVVGNVYLDFIAAWDSEPGYDFTCIQFDQCDDNWIAFDLATGYYGCGLSEWGLDRFSLEIPDTSHAGSLRLRFHFTSDGGWSDEDGSWNTDGAFILDSLTVSDASGQVLPTELFESESVGDNTTLSGNWEATVKAGFGDFSGLFSGLEMFELDPCRDNLTCVWAFIDGTTADYTCGGYPAVPAIPYGNMDGQYLSNEIWSPVFSNAGTGSTFEYHFDVYRDLPLDNLIFFVWHVRDITGGCPNKWEDSNFVFYSDTQDWSHQVFDVSTFLDPGSSSFQLALGAVDMCPFWCGSQGTGSCHANAPMFDNPALYRINSNGPVWSVRDFELFQDNFAADGTTTGTVRADMANNVAGYGVSTIVPGDSVVVTVKDPERPLSTDPHAGGPAVYAYVGVWPQGQTSKSGTNLSDDPSRWPVVDSLMHDGDKWYCVRMDTVYLSSGSPQPDRYCVDLRDDLFTPGDTVCYVFAAQSAGYNSYFSTFTGRTDDLDYALNNPMEFTCLPTQSPFGGTRVLYVDNFDGLGAQPFFDTAFDQLGIAGMVDRYDILGASRFADNGPASRVSDVFNQVIPIYHTIIWNSGDLTRGTVSEGSNDSPDDFGLLYDFINNKAVPGGVYLSGDHLADEWDSYWFQEFQFRNQYMNFNVANENHVDYGLGVSPLVIGTPGSCFDHVTGPDTLVAFGGCTPTDEFNVLEATGNSTMEAAFLNGITSGGAVLAQSTVNAESTVVGAVLSGFSFHRIRDARPNNVSARAEHLKDILLWLGGMSPTATNAPKSRYAYTLSQNYPNPFNPVTAIEFTVAERTPVQLRVYNVRGQLVRTLVDDERSPGIVHRVEWDGRNNSGARVASGVYFYKLSTTAFATTRKMVMLK